MWGLAAGPLDSGSAANVWLLLGTIVSTLGAVTSTVITVWLSRSNTNHDDVSDAIDEYRETFTEPLRADNEQLRKRLAECLRKKRAP